LVAGGLAALMLVLIGLPLVALIVRAIHGLTAPDALRLIASRPVLDAVSLSLGTTALSALIIVLLGTPLAYAFARYQFPLKRFFNVLVELPIVLPPVVAGLALLMAFGRRGLFGGSLAALGINLPFSTAAVVVAQVFVAAPFYIRAAQVGFQGVPSDLEEAACIDGASEWQTLRFIILPMTMRALIAGLVLSWARALGEFGATVLFAGSLQGRTQTMPLLVYNALERDFDAALWAGVLLVWVAVMALGLMRGLGRAVEADR